MKKFTIREYTVIKSESEVMAANASQAKRIFMQNRYSNKEVNVLSIDEKTDIKVIPPKENDK